MYCASRTPTEWYLNIRVTALSLSWRLRFLYTRDNPFDKKGLEAWFSSFGGPIQYENRDLNITAGDQVAFCHSLGRMIATTTNGPRIDIWFRHTLGFRKIDGRWKITHEHSSVPFYMDGSHKAAVDLKP